MSQYEKKDLTKPLFSTKYLFLFKSYEQWLHFLQNNPEEISKISRILEEGFSHPCKIVIFKSKRALNVIQKIYRAYIISCEIYKIDQRTKSGKYVKEQIQKRKLGDYDEEPRIKKKSSLKTLVQ